MDAIEWLKENSGPSDVVMSWWDYGYWIVFVANRTVMADGLTINSSQIRQIARSFMGTELEAYEMALLYNVSYIMVDIGYEVSFFDGTGKWMAIGWIAGEFENSPFNLMTRRKFIQEDLPKFFRFIPAGGGRGVFVPRLRTLNLTLFRMAAEPLGIWELPELRFFELVYVSEESEYPRVVVFRVRA